MRTLVVGLARSGVAAARLLGADVVAVDRGRPDVDLPGVEVHLDTDGIAYLDGVGQVVKSPGVPRGAPVIAEALRRGIPVLGELELAWRALRAGHRFVAVTGTNGKTTTVELLGHVWRTAGLPVAVAGNVGTPLASLPGTLAPGTTVVCEASSFQLEDAVDFAPQCAVLLNLAPDHLDRHGSFAHYRDSKLRIFAGQQNDDVAVAPSDLEGVEDLGGCARRVCFGERPDDDVALRAGVLFWDSEPLLRTGDLALRGAHNVRNAMAAAGAALAGGVDIEAVREGLRTFAGVPHRLEQVAVCDGVTYVNDSKATNVASTLVALAAYADRPVHLILGGQGKGQSFATLRGGAPAAAVYLIGEDAERIADELGTGLLCGDLATAVARARAAAAPGSVVLLSPACASFDQFADFEARGAAFRELVTNMR